MNQNWPITLKEIHHRAVAACGEGASMDSVFTASDTAFLESIYIKPVNVWEYAKDFSESGAPAWEAFLLMVAVRRYHFLFITNGKWEGATLTPADLPAKGEEFEGVEGLPRVVRKAAGFLRGILRDDIVYGDAEDRAVLTKLNVAAADFLRLVWAMEGDCAKVKNFLTE